MLGGDAPVDAEQHKQWKEAIAITPAHPGAMKSQLKQVQKLFETVMTDLLRERTTKTRSGYQVDAIADIGNEAVAIAAAHFFHVQLKSEEHKDGQLTAQQLYTIMALCFAYTFLDVDESKDFALRLYATQAGSALMDLVKIDVKAVKHKDTLGRLLNLFPGYKHADDLAESFGAVLIKRLLAKGMTPEEITGELVPNLAGMIAPLSQQVSCILSSTLASLLTIHAVCPNSRLLLERQVHFALDDNQAPLPLFHRLGLSNPDWLHPRSHASFSCRLWSFPHRHPCQWC